MFNNNSGSKICVIVGGSHAGVNAAFNLRKEGWNGQIILVDKDPELPYHRPPLSKSFLLKDDDISQYALKPKESYIQDDITLKLGMCVQSIDSSSNRIVLSDETSLSYDVLILATGAEAIIPPIPGIHELNKVYPLRSAQDVYAIKSGLKNKTNANVIIIGGGYIGLEIASSLNQLGHSVQVLEREKRILSRVTAPEVSLYFTELHTSHGVKIHTDKHVSNIHEDEDETMSVHCSDGSEYVGDMIILGVGIRVNCTLALSAGIHIENGIQVDQKCQTSIPNIYAVGDCTFHYNPIYNRNIRLESVQNAVDQAKVVAANICNHSAKYDSVPWFWSDQYDIKFQIVGLSQGYTEVISRIEDEHKRSYWYFKENQLIAVDAINNAKAYVIGMKCIKGNLEMYKTKLADPNILLKPNELFKH